MEDLADAIEKGSKIDATYLKKFVASSGLELSIHDCGDAITRARMTVTLAAFASAESSVDVSLIDIAARDGLESVRHRLFCNPLDGNAWLRFSELLVQTSGPSRTAIDALKLSYLTAPAEMWVVESRLPFATRLYLAGVSGFVLQYREDLRRFVANDNWPQVAKTYVDTVPRIRELLYPLIAAQPDQRRKAIVGEIDRLGMVF